MDVGLVSDALQDVGAIREAAESVGATVERIDGENVRDEDYDCIPAQGPSGVSTVLESDVTGPILPIDCERGLEAVPLGDLPAAFRTIETKAAKRVERPAIAVNAPDGQSGRGVLEAVIVTAEPATISEFEITADGQHVAEYRADGIVIATPAGSGGYARTVGAPVIGPESDVLSVTTIAPYRTDPDTWIVNRRGVRVTVTRDESEVYSFVDGEALAPVKSGESVCISGTHSYDTLRVPQSIGPFDRVGD